MKYANRPDVKWLWGIILLLVLAGAALAAGFGSLEGTVTDADSKEPVSGAQVRVEVGNGIQTGTDEKGSFAFGKNIPQGKYKVTVRSDGYDTKEIKNVRIESKTKKLTVALCKTGSEAAECKAAAKKDKKKIDLKLKPSAKKNVKAEKKKDQNKNQEQQE